MVGCEQCNAQKAASTTGSLLYRRLALQAARSSGSMLCWLWHGVEAGACRGFCLPALPHLLLL